MNIQKQIKSTVSEKNTKAEIIEAYNDILSRLEEKDDKSTKVEQPEQRKLLDSTEKETVEKITTDLSQLRLTANQTIASLTERLTQEAERLVTIKKAIAIARQELEDTQKVKIKASQLYQMIELQKNTEEEFNHEMELKRRNWEEEQKIYEDQKKRVRTREEDEYEYNKKMQRQRDKEIWDEEKRKQEREKEDEAKAKELMLTELEELRKKVLTFPAELEKEIKLKVAEAVNRVQHEAQIQQRLINQESNTKLQLESQKVLSLEAALQALRTETRELKLQLDKATNNIKDIAVSVVEGRRETSLSTRMPPQDFVK